MYRLSSLVFLLLFIGDISAQSPHGDLYQDCGTCHNANSWDINIDTFHFNHDTFTFSLTGVHLIVDCKDCHNSLVFDNTPSECINCHDDIHNMSVGNECIRCHNSENWLIDNIPELHEENGFPLIGAHDNINCVDCHTAEPITQYNIIGNECSNCHLDTYFETNAPNHLSEGFSTECTICHNPFALEWDLGGHSFFPLTEGHNIQDCNVCHVHMEFANTSSDCFACHKLDYENALEPNHTINQFPTECSFCHTTELGWPSDNFQQHDELYFPIYSGKHSGEWNECIDCHTEGNFISFDCLQCHEHNDKSKLDRKHEGESDYIYESNACYKCHPNGDE